MTRCRTTSAHWCAAWALLAVAALICAGGAAPAESTNARDVRVRLTAAQKEITFSCDAPIIVGQDKAAQALPAGMYTLRAADVTPAKQRFQLFVKTFLPSEMDNARAHAAEWKQQGYAAEILTFGKQFKTSSGTVVDNRNLWVSVARPETMEKAAALKKKLEAQSVWGWIQPETTRPGKGRILVRNKAGKTVLKTQAPAQLNAKRPIEIRDLDFGFWKPQREHRAYAGTLDVAIGPDGLLEICEKLPIEEYLAGVLPAEMPAKWPIEALKAQAVAARSEVFASMAGKHSLEGFDFCGTEHCRAYLGTRGRKASTDRAVSETAGMALTSGGRIVPAVFSANCGGWTEDNDTVWSAPPNPALRAIADFPQSKAPKNAPGDNVVRWLGNNDSAAFCSGNHAHFRWRRRFKADELTALVNRKYGVGKVRAIELGDRGPSGRLKWIKIVGSKSTEMIRKELNIRLAFGGLNSAMFIVEKEGSADGPASFTFVGGGRGHGVGLCQDGAYAMAMAGFAHEAIVKHYFAHAETLRLR